MRYDNYFKGQLAKRYFNGESVEDICIETGIPKSTLYSWVKPHNTTTTESGIEINPDKFYKLMRTNEKLASMIEVLQKVNCTVSSPLKVKLSELELLYGQYSVYVLCDALKVDRGTFYNHVRRNKKDNTTYQIRRDHLSEKIKEIFDDSRQIYGPKKIWAVLREQGERTSDRMVAELMDEMNLYSIRTGAKKEYNRIEKKERKDKLSLNFTTDKPNEVWVSDVTCFRINRRMFNICVIMDLYSRKVVAYKLSLKNSSQLVTGTIKLAYNNRQPQAGLVFHTDRGSSFAAYQVEKLLKSMEVTHSFSPKGNPYRNSVIESFFSSLKKEELYRSNYKSENEFKKKLDEYFEFYNNERPHATISYRTPNAYEDLFYKNNPTKNN